MPFDASLLEPVKKGFDPALLESVSPVADDSFEGQLVGGETVSAAELAKDEKKAELFAQQKQAREKGEYWEGVQKRLGNLTEIAVEPLSRPLSGVVGRALDVPISAVTDKVSLEETIRQGGIKLPKAGEAETTGGKIVAGAYNAVADLTAMFSNPDTVALLPAAVNKGVLSVWLGQIAGAQPERAVKAAGLFKEGKTQEAVQEVVTGIGELALVEVGRRHITPEQSLLEIRPDVASVEATAAAGGKPLARPAIDPLLDPLAGSRVRQTDVAPLAIAAEKAKAADAPATAAVLEQMVTIPRDVPLVPKPQAIQIPDIDAAGAFKGIREIFFEEPSGIVGVERGAVRENPQGGQVSFSAEAPTLLHNVESWADRKIGESKDRLNVGVDPELMAAYVVKGAASLARGAIRFTDWSADMVRQFGEEVRPLLDDIYTKAINYRDSLAKVGTEKTEAPPTPVVKKSLTTATPKPSRPLGEWYSEPLPERIRRLGGPVSGKVADEALQITDHAKRLYGDLSSRVLDEAKRSAGRAFRGGTTWIQGKNNVTDRAATSRFHEALETAVTTGNMNHVPAHARALAQKLFDTNLEIGRLAQQANPAFLATGKAQRMLTGYGHDVVLRGRGPAWDAWTEGLAAANGKPIRQVQGFFRRWKKELDAPGVDAAGLDKIAQDFVREFPKAITHIKPLAGWHEVIHSSPFQYLEQAAQRTASAVAFREVYPVGSGLLDATRTAVQRELKTDTAKNEFDNMIRALQGHPTDRLTTGLTAPDTITGAASRTVGTLAKPVRSGMLTQSLAVNIGETVSGGAQIFLGYDAPIRAAARRGTLYRDLERSGMVNRAIRDFSFDPTSPFKSTTRYLSNLISRSFLNDFANEFQEYTGAASARFIADEVRAGTLTPREQTMLVNTMRAAGIPKEQAIEAAAGRNAEALNQFETKAAEFLSAGNQLTGEKSRMGSSRIFNELFWFHSYPMAKVRQARSILNNIIEDATAKDWAGAYSNSKLMGRFLGGTTLGGAVTVGVMSLVGAGLYGLGIKKREAQDDFGDFVKESFLMGMGGPLQIANRIFEEGGDPVEGTTQGVLNSVTPYSMAKELSQASAGTGRYEGLDAGQRIGEFLRSKTPGLKPFKLGMAAWGLSQDDPKLDAAIKAYYRWRKDTFGKTTVSAGQFEEPDRKGFRGHMKQAVRALQRGDEKEYEARLDQALELESVSMKNVKSSIGARTILQRPDGKALSDEEEMALRSRIGDDAVDRIMDYDAMLKAISR